MTLAGEARMLAAAVGDLASPGLHVVGDLELVPALLGVLDQLDPRFSIVTP